MLVQFLFFVEQHSLHFFLLPERERLCHRRRRRRPPRCSVNWIAVDIIPIFSFIVVVRHFLTTFCDALFSIRCPNFFYKNANLKTAKKMTMDDDDYTVIMMTLY